MSKSILILDTPKSCGDCRFCEYNDSIKTSICTADPARMFKMNDEGAIYSILVDERCPLRPLPLEKMEGLTFDYAGQAFTKEMAIGWNACLNKILGEGE